MRRRRRKGRAEALGSVISRDRTFRGIDLELPPLPSADWERAVGTRIASHTRPTKLERGTLYVVTSSAAWSQELSLLSETILARLRKLRVDATTLRFRVGRVDADERMLNRRPPKRAPREVTIDEPLALAMAAVPDDDLRRALLSAAKRALGFDGPGANWPAANATRPTTSGPTTNGPGSGHTASDRTGSDRTGSDRNRR